MKDTKIKVLFVCLGNICRSPSAQAVFRKLVNDKNLQSHIQTDSAGTANYHTGNSPDSRATHFAQIRGYDLTDLRARQVLSEDFLTFDYIIAMDQHNLQDLKLMLPRNHSVKLALMLDYLSKESQQSDVPDPYYGGDQGFNQVLDLLEDACQGLLNCIIKKHITHAAKD